MACANENGRVVWHGAATELQAHEDIRECRLGLSVASWKKNSRFVKHCKRRKRWLG